MSYVIEHKVGDRVYLYRVTSYWDKDKKQARQKREYIGPKERVNRFGKRLRKDQSKYRDVSGIVSKSYGDIYLCEELFAMVRNYYTIGKKK